MLKQEDWPAMAPELDEIKASYAVFFLFPIAYIPRSLNVRADCLAKRPLTALLKVAYHAYRAGLELY